MIVCNPVVPRNFLDSFLTPLELLSAVKISWRLHNEEAQDCSDEVEEAGKPEEVLSVLAYCNEVDSPDNLNRPFCNHQTGAYHRLVLARHKLHHQQEPACHPSNDADTEYKRGGVDYLQTCDVSDAEHQWHLDRQRSTKDRLATP